MTQITPAADGLYAAYQDARGNENLALPALADLPFPVHATIVRGKEMWCELIDELSENALKFRRAAEQASADSRTTERRRAKLLADWQHAQRVLRAACEQAARYCALYGLGELAEPEGLKQ